MDRAVVGTVSAAARQGKARLPPPQPRMRTVSRVYSLRMPRIMVLTRDGWAAMDMERSIGTPSSSTSTNALLGAARENAPPSLGRWMSSPGRPYSALAITNTRIGTAWRMGSSQLDGSKLTLRLSACGWQI